MDDNDLTIRIAEIAGLDYTVDIGCIWVADEMILYDPLKNLNHAIAAANTFTRRELKAGRPWNFDPKTFIAQKEDGEQDVFYRVVMTREMGHAGFTAAQVATPETLARAICLVLVDAAGWGK